MSQQRMIASPVKLENLPTIALVVYINRVCARVYMAMLQLHLAVNNVASIMSQQLK